MTTVVWTADVVSVGLAVKETDGYVPEHDRGGDRRTVVCTL